ncbi:MAG: hydrogenase maturation protease [Streptosporangiaceae bacterium]|jgi:hydrogenase maturation protease
MTGRLLMAGVGNIFLGDDGFGVEVASRLAGAELPDWVRVADYGIRGMHLAYDLASGYDSAILIDATPRGGEPGTIYVIEPERPPAAAAGATAQAGDGPAEVGGSLLFNAHGMQPDVVLRVLDMLGAEAGPLLVVGCEPASVDYGIGLSEPVEAAVDEAIRVVLDLVASAGSGRLGHQYRPAVAAEPQAAGRASAASAISAEPADERALSRSPAHENSASPQ